MKKQETLEEFIKEILQDEFFTNIAEYKKAERLIEIGAKWQQEQQDCCTPANQIKRYVDCVGCDRKPKEMSKQTSVDFLIEEFSAILGKVNFTAMQGLLLKDAVEEARHMHEVEIMRAFYDGNPTCYQDKDGQQYYNKTYKKEDK